MEELPLKYCLYARKSTEAEEKQALSIDSQIKEMTQIAERENLTIVEIRKESHSAKESSTRTVFEEIVKDIDIGLFNGFSFVAVSFLELEPLKFIAGQSFYSCLCGIANNPFRAVYFYKKLKTKFLLPSHKLS